MNLISGDADDFIVDLDTQTLEIIQAAANHDLPTLKKLLALPGAASVQDLETGTTPLHAAIDACGPAEGLETEKGLKASSESDGTEREADFDIEKAKETVHELFLSGAIWNDLDAKDETPGCLAYRLGQMELYEMVVEAGVRAEMLMNLMGGYEELESQGSEDEEDEDVTGPSNLEEVERKSDQVGVNTLDASYPSQGRSTDHEAVVSEKKNVEEPASKRPKHDVNSKDYLASDLTFTGSVLLDADANGVMMDWETPIMVRTAELLTKDRNPELAEDGLAVHTEASESEEGLQAPLRVLNIGYGMGIIDGLFAAQKPSIHHIMEAHPAVLERLLTTDCPFGPAWQSQPGHRIIAGKWQDEIENLVESGAQYDVIYFDTFGESYSQLKLFFSEYGIALLSSSGRFSFFNGLGADRQVCYDVYCRVVDLDLADAGFETAWHDVAVQMENLDKDGEGEWKGVKRRYWTLDTYRLPVVKLMD